MLLVSGKAIFGVWMFHPYHYLNYTSNFVYGFNLISKLICMIALALLRSH